MKTSKQKLQKQLNDIQKQLDNFGVDKETLSDLLRPKIHELIDVKFGIRPTELIPKDKTKIPLVTKLEVGKWYKEEGDDNFLICITNPFDSNDSGYGFAHYNCGWADSLGTWSFKPILATEKEVETALIKEAIKRGLNKSNIIINVYNGKNCNSNTFSYFKYSGVKLLAYDSKGLYTPVFKNGVWAEIVENAKPKINGYEMEIDGKNGSFGCAKFHKTWFQNLHSQITKRNNQVDSFEYSNRKIKSFTLDSGVEITLEQLKEIVEYLNK